ncbi:MAG: YfbU family protein [Polyangiaceae bacterium]
MSKVSLSKVERVLLINQFEILKRFEPTAARYEEKIEILRSGYS